MFAIEPSRLTAVSRDNKLALSSPLYLLLLVCSFGDVRCARSAERESIRMRVTPLKPDSEHCNECRRRASYRVRIRNTNDVSLCNRCAVRLVIRLVELIASPETLRPASSSTPSRRKEFIRKL
jgi:hypothetical protein